MKLVEISSSEDKQSLPANTKAVGLHGQNITQVKISEHSDTSDYDVCESYHSDDDSIDIHSNYGYTTALHAVYEREEIYSITSKYDNTAESYSNKCRLKQSDVISTERSQCSLHYNDKISDDCQQKVPDVEKIKEKQMLKVMQEIVLYVVFLLVQMSVTYRTVTPESYLMSVNLENIFINEKANTQMLFNNMRNVDEFWMWVRTGFLNGLQVNREYNSVSPSTLPGYINDGVSFIVGFATMRQLRVRPGLCKTSYLLRDIIHECNDYYKSSRKDRRTYGPGWVSLPKNVTADNSKKTPYIYRSAHTIQGYPYWGQRQVYGGGGYLVELKGNRSAVQQVLATLESQGWIDQYTRVVFIEFTVYNPNVNYFCIATILVEFERTGATLQSYRFEPAMLLTYRSHAMIFQVICEIAFFAFTVSFLVIQIRNIIRQRMKYFNYFWHYFELTTIFCAIIAIVVYFYRFAATKQLTRQINKTRGTKYIKFQYVGYWNAFFYYIFGWVVFFGVLKFIKLLRFNKRMFMLSGTWRYGAKSLSHFGVIFWLTFMAFAQLFYLTFMSTMYSFRHIMASTESCFTILLGIFDIYTMTVISPILSKFYIFFFVLTIGFVVLNMFMSILNETFARVREEIQRRQNKYEIIEFLGQKIRTTPKHLNNKLRQLARSSKRLKLNKMDNFLNSMYKSRVRMHREELSQTMNRKQLSQVIKFKNEDSVVADKLEGNINSNNVQKQICKSNDPVYTLQMCHAVCAKFDSVKPAEKPAVI